MSAARKIRPETEADRAQGDALIEAAFGPGRLAKAAERLREGRIEGPAIALVADGPGRLAGVVRLWPVTAGEARALFLGPIAVDQSARGAGLGRALIAEACERARVAGWEAIVLVGEPALFQPFGFSREAAAHLAMPGPVDRRRLLACELVPGAAQRLAGLLQPA